MAVTIAETGGHVTETALKSPLSPPVTMRRNDRSHSPKYALHQQATPPEPPKAVHTLAELWAAVGCRSAWRDPTKAERLREARTAQQQAFDRHARPRPKPRAPALRVVDGDGWVRERDADAQDVSAWD